MTRFHRICDPASPYEEEATARFKGHDIHVTREPECNWYIRVSAPSGLYAYDGYWRESFSRTMAEAVEEAKRGACLIATPAPQEKNP